MTLTVTEAAAILRVNRRTVMNWCRAGKLRAFRTPGGHWRIDEAEIDTARRRPYRFFPAPDHAMRPQECFTCPGTAWAIAESDVQPAWNDSPWRLYQCDRCGAVFSGHD